MLSSLPTLIATLLLVALSGFACSGDDEEVVHIPENQGSDLGEHDDVGVNNAESDMESLDGGDDNDAAPNYDCITCETLDCYDFCDGEVELAQPSPIHTCDTYPRFEAPGDILLHLDPTDYPNLFNIDGCNAPLDTPEIAFSIIAPLDGILEFIFLYPGDSSTAPPLVYFAPQEEGFDICSGVFNASCAVEGSTASNRSIAAFSVPVTAGQEIPIVLEVPQATDLAILTAYVLPKVALGEECRERNQCPDRAVCNDSICSCSESTVPQNGACVCPAGTVFSPASSACIEDPCAADPAPCEPDQICELDENNNPLCFTPEPVADLGENCRNAECAEGLRCETITVCPFDGILHPICVTPCSDSTQCNAGNIACSRTGPSSPTCTGAGNTGRLHCNWD